MPHGCIAGCPSPPGRGPGGKTHIRGQCLDHARSSPRARKRRSLTDRDGASIGLLVAGGLQNDPCRFSASDGIAASGRFTAFDRFPAWDRFAGRIVLLTRIDKRLRIDPLSIFLANSGSRCAPSVSSGALRVRMKRTAASEWGGHASWQSATDLRNLDAASAGCGRALLCDRVNRSCDGDPQPARHLQLRAHTQHRQAMAHLPSPECEPTKSRFFSANGFCPRKSATAWPPAWRRVPASFEVASLPIVPSAAAA
jgi:hypothetical protein